MALLSSQLNSGEYAELFAFTHGIDADKLLWREEIAVQVAWVGALEKAQLLSNTESQQIRDCLKQAAKLMQEDRFEWKIEDEDIHMNIERFVTESLGELGKRMHLGRSRNDLIATSLRLYVAHQMQDIRAGMANMGKALCQQAAGAQAGVAIPGMTHLQHAQPITYGHWLLSHACAFRRDIKRCDSAIAEALAYMPLGAGALAGSHLDLDFEALRKDLGFKELSLNSYDAIAERDFILTALFALAQMASHISRLSEDIIFYSSSAVGLLRLPKNYSTGSSLMPNKRNPDVAELSRAKAARVQAALTEAFGILKGLPMAYNSDLHELKRCLQRSLRESLAMLKIWPGMLTALSIDEACAARLIGKGHLLATDLANAFVAGGLSFRQAYQKSAEWVNKADSQGLQVHELGEAKELLGEKAFEESFKKRPAPGSVMEQERIKSLKIIEESFK